MNNYSPRVYDFFVPMIIFAIAEASMHTTWKIFAYVMYGLGALSVFVILYAFISEIHNNSADDMKAPEDNDDDRPNESSTVHVTISDGAGHMKLFDLPASTRQLTQIATGLLVASDPFTQRRWTGKGRPFSRTQFESLIATMINKGLAYQVNKEHPQQGYALTRVGIHFLRKYLPSPIASEFTTEDGDVSHARTDARTTA